MLSGLDTEKRLFTQVFLKAEYVPCPVCNILLKVTPYSDYYPHEQLNHCVQKVNGFYKVICPHQRFRKVNK